jgi:hypothetical protein
MYVGDALSLKPVFDRRRDERWTREKDGILGMTPRPRSEA